jgi:catechol 2,3-dioxygenase-like lactoylglutathione lyase family enzyme
VTYDPLLISLPVADRVRAHDFYRDGLGLEAIGELADDGVPEPLMFVLNPMTPLMLVPNGGCGWSSAITGSLRSGRANACSASGQRPTTTSIGSSNGHEGQARRLPRSQRHSRGATQRPSPIPTVTSGVTSAKLPD